MKIGVSTCCFKEKYFRNFCIAAVKLGVDVLELSANVTPMELTKAECVIEEFQGRLEFEVHNYFPSPLKPFVLNLAHPSTLDISMSHCRKALEFCSRNGIKRYSIHAGFAINPDVKDIGNRQDHLKKINFFESEKILMDALCQLSYYANELGVKLLIENNVVSRVNAPNGKNSVYHFSGEDLTDGILNLFLNNNLGILLDFGHLKVSAQTLKFDADKCFDNWKPFIKAVHINENDGLSDLNWPVDLDSWFWSKFSSLDLSYIALEVYGLSFEKLRQQVELVRKCVKNYDA
ncbi:MAG: sugar phosphate isomerase/epimerase family protein [Candidatus Scalinduaceae bacterium]